MTNVFWSLLAATVGGLGRTTQCESPIQLSILEFQIEHGATSRTPESTIHDLSGDVVGSGGHQRTRHRLAGLRQSVGVAKAAYLTTPLPLDGLRGCRRNGEGRESDEGDDDDEERNEKLFHRFSPLELERDMIVSL